MADGYSRGHKIVYSESTGWIYADNGLPVDDKRPCARCGRAPLDTGEDACLGHIDGVISACCGHGVSTPIMIKEINNDKSVR